MKILIIGEENRFGLTQSFKRGFEELGHRTEILDDWKIYRKSSWLARNKYIHHFGGQFLAVLVQSEIFEAVKKEKPELVLIFKGWLISPKTIERIKKEIKCLIFNYNPDNPFNTWHHGNSNFWIRRSIPLFDAYFIWGKFLVKFLYGAGAKRAEYLPFAYDPVFNHPMEVLAEEKKIFTSDIAFMGSWDKERESWLSRLMDYDLKIWGDSWEKANKNIQNKWQGRAVTGEEFSKICASSKIILNFIRKQNGSAHNMRTYEVPACRGFLLSTRTDEQLEIFKEGREADYFSSADELRKKIDFYLDNEKKRNEILKAGYKKIISGKNTYRDRAEKIISVYKSIISNIL